MSLPFAVPAHWQIVPFGDLVKDSAFGPRFGAEHYAKDGNIATLRIMDISDDGVISYSAMPLARLPEEKFRNHFLKENDLVIARTGVTCGTAAVFGDWHSPVVPGAFLIRFRLTPTVVPKYYCYFFNLSNGRKHLLSVSSGACQTNLNITSVKRLAVPSPPLEEQNAVVNFLSSYDDLIENNARRIKLLEEIAKLIYREWFVNFRFPGHERVKMVESEMGPIPVGWTVEPLRELTILISRGISPQYDDEAKGLVINQKCIRDGRLSLDPARKQSKKVPADKLIRLGDVLINSTGVGTLGRVAQVLEPISDCTVDSHVSIVRPKNNSEFLGKTLLQLEQHFDRLGIGSTGQTELSRERIGSTKLIVPTTDLQERFSRVVAPMNRVIVCCLARNSNLRQTRDLLLPKLIFGEVSVKESEAETVAQGV